MYNQVNLDNVINVLVQEDGKFLMSRKQMAHYRIVHQYLSRESEFYKFNEFIDSMKSTNDLLLDNPKHYFKTYCFYLLSKNALGRKIENNIDFQMLEEMIIDMNLEEYFWKLFSNFYADEVLFGVIMWYEDLKKKEKNSK